MKSDKRVRILTGNVTPLFFRYLGPSITSTVMISLNYFIDTICVGQRVGEMGLASLSIAQPAAGLLYAIGFLFGVGGATLFSIHMGRGEKKKAQEYYTNSIAVMLLIGLIIGVLGLVFLRPITRFLGGTGESYQGAADYLTYIFWFAPLFSVECFLSVFLRNDRAPRLAMLANLSASVLNIILDVYFIFYLDMGMVGASLATSLGICLAVVIQLAAVFFRKGSNLRFRRAPFRFRTLFAVMHSGAASFVQEMTQSVVMLTFNNVLMVISGEMAVAVYGVIGNLAIIVGSAINGVSGAMQPLVSANAGAGKQYRVKSILKLAVLSSFVLSMICVLIAELRTDWIIRMFLNADQIFLAMALPGVRIAAFSFLLVAANVLFTVYFQSVEANNEALVLSLLRGVAFPVASVLFCALFFGLMGAWASIVLSEALSLLVALICLVRVQGKLRERNYQQLNFFTRKGKVEETLDQILDQLGAEDLSGFTDLIHYCNSRDEDREGIPAFIGLDDLTSDYEGAYSCAPDDEGYGLWLAIGSLLFTDLFEQNEEYMKEKMKDLNYPAAAPAMSALAEKCFRFLYDEDSDETDIVAYRDVVEKFVRDGREAAL